MRWDCKERGCFNWKQRPKIEVFCESFPGRINFSDIDGIVEIAGNALLLEWKGEPMEIPTGQRIMYERLTSSGSFVVLVLAGDARVMKITHQRYFKDGRGTEWRKSSLDHAKDWMKRWAEFARANSLVTSAKLEIVGAA